MSVAPIALVWGALRAYAAQRVGEMHRLGTVHARAGNAEVADAVAAAAALWHEAEKKLAQLEQEAT